MTPSVRPRDRAGFTPWDRLFQGYIALYDTERAPDFRRAYSEPLLAGDPHDYACLVALAGDRTVGLARDLFHAHGWHARPVCYLQDLYADPAHRGRGVGRTLVEAVYAQAGKKDASGVCRTTQHFNETACRLYDRVGRPTPVMK